MAHLKHHGYTVVTITAIGQHDNQETAVVQKVMADGSLLERLGHRGANGRWHWTGYKITRRYSLAAIKKESPDTYNALRRAKRGYTNIQAAQNWARLIRATYSYAVQTIPLWADEIRIIVTHLPPELRTALRLRDREWYRDD